MRPARPYQAPLNGAAPLRGSDEWLLTRTRAALHAALDGIAVTDETGAIELTNLTLCTLFGYRAHQLADQPLSLLIPELAAEPEEQQRRLAFLAREQPGTATAWVGRHGDGRR